MFDFFQKLIRPGAQTESAENAAPLSASDRIAELKKRGMNLATGGNLAEAAQCYRQATEADPLDAAAFAGLGRVLCMQNRWLEARPALDRALVLNGDEPQAHMALGMIALHLHELPKAIYRFGESVRIEPGLMEAHERLADALLAIGDDVGAEKVIVAGVHRFPQSASLVFSMGKLNKGRNLPLRALENYQHAVAMEPQNAQMMAALGIARDDAGDHDSAVDLMRRALELKPSSAPILHEMGIRFWSRVCYEDAARCFRAAIALDPDHLRSHMDLGFVSLVMGDYATGWPQYEWRFQVEQQEGVRPHKTFSQPLWLGEQSVEGKTILLHCEQGYGDTLQFCRYAADVAALGALVVLQVQKGLTELMAGLEGVSMVVEQDSPLPYFDVHCPLMSLPLALGHQHTGYIPSKLQYLKADPVKKEAWQRRLDTIGPTGTPKIGVVWSGYANHIRDSHRSLALAEFLGLLPVGIHAVCLQPEVRGSDMPVMLADGRVTFLGTELKSFSDTAALVDALDLVVTVDTSVAHLAGALGKSVWLLISHIPDWRWLLDREDSPWYPGVTLFRQRIPGDWSQPLAQVRAALVKRYKPVMGLSGGVAAKDPARCVELVKKGNGLLGQGRLEEAGDCYRQATIADPSSPSAFVNLGYVFSEQKLFLQAIAALEYALELDPNQPDAHYMLGTMAQQETSSAEAISQFRQVLQIEPRFELAYQELGYELFRNGEIAEAQKVILSGLDYFPQSAQLLCNLGNAQVALKSPVQAIESYQKALALAPDNAQYVGNLGTAYVDAGEEEKAVSMFRRALELNLQNADTLVDMGRSLWSKVYIDDAIRCFRAAIQASPEHEIAHLYLGLIALLIGDYATGWPEYEWRFKIRRPENIAARKIFKQPLWLGQSSLKGKTILVHCEQGYGDTLQFCRYVTEVAALADRVVFQVQPGLRALMATLKGVDHLVEENEKLPEFDVQCPLLSLPLALGHHRNGTILSLPRYLDSNPHDVARWKHRLAELGSPGELRVGVTWSGHAGQYTDSLRSMALVQFLKAVPEGMRVVCLMPQVRETDLPLLQTDKRVIFVGSELRTFADTAALMDSLDLVISSDTSVAHLAGALGKPAWVLLARVPDWRWLLDREDNPWYPHTRVFRQQDAGDWAPPLQQVHDALLERYQPRIP